MKSGGEATAAGPGSRQPVESGPELLVVDRDLAVEHQRVGGRLGDRRRDAADAPRVVDAVAAHQPDAVAVLVGDDAPAVGPIGA